MAELSRVEDGRNVVKARRTGVSPVRNPFRFLSAGRRGRLSAGRRSRSLRSVLIGAIVLACLLVPIGPASAQLDARERPRVRGPLAFVSKRCEQRVDRAGDRIIATSRSCFRFLAFDPAQENNSSRNFGVLWMQSNVNARKRWCATEAKSIIRFPGRVRVLDVAPGDRGASQPRLVRARLRVDNATDNPATIRNAFRLYPRVLRTRKINEGTGFQAVWRGSTRRALGFALGVELSWAEGSGPPSASSLLDFSLKRRLGSC